MMHPEDEANSDAPLVPDVSTRNRTQTIDRPTDRTTPLGTYRSDFEPVRRELEAIRSRLETIETQLTEETDRR